MFDWFRKRRRIFHDSVSQERGRRRTVTAFYNNARDVRCVVFERDDGGLSYYFESLRGCQTNRCCQARKCGGRAIPIRSRACTSRLKSQSPRNSHFLVIAVSIRSKRATHLALPDCVASPAILPNGNVRGLLEQLSTCRPFCLGLPFEIVVHRARALFGRTL